MLRVRRWSRPSIAAVAVVASVLDLAACRGRAREDAAPGATGDASFSLAISTGDASSSSAVSVATIAAGTPVWFETNPATPNLNARVDLGTLRSVGDELEVHVRWPPSPGERIDARLEGKPIPPEGSVWHEVVRVVCTPTGPLSYYVDNRLVGPDGTEVRHLVNEPATARAEQERRRPLLSYGTSPRDLACWAAARKCDGAPFTWPPPRNLAPLDDSERATRMRAEHNARFVPQCRL